MYFKVKGTAKFTKKNAGRRVSGPILYGVLGTYSIARIAPSLAIESQRISELVN